MTKTQKLDFLNYNKYKDLEEKAQEAKAAKDYRQFKEEEEERFGYNVYCNSPCESKEDLIRIAGMAYAWMPRMIRLHFNAEYRWEGLLGKIKEFKDGNTAIRADVIQELSKNIDNSIVATSKVLHFINPEFAPIIDSRVIRGWNCFFSDRIDKKEVCKLPSSLSFNEKNHLQKIKQYIDYWDILLVWKSNLEGKVSIRDIEFPFYCIGEKPLKRNKEK